MAFQSRGEQSLERDMRMIALYPIHRSKKDNLVGVAGMFTVVVGTYVLASVIIRYSMSQRVGNDS